MELARIDHDYILKLKHFALSAIFTLRDDLVQSIAQNLDALGLRRGEYVGIHVRHGDKGREATLLPVEKYVPEIDRALQEFGLSTVFLASDDDNMEQELQAALGSSVRVVRQHSAGNSYSWRTGDLTSDTAAASELALLTDISALRMAKTFVGTGSSSLGRLVSHLRGPDEPSVSLDWPWHFCGA